MSETKKTVSTSDCPKVSYREIIGFDANGEIVYDVVKKHCWENGSGFVISYIDAICDLVKKSDITGSTLRLFLYIAHNQPYGSDGLHFGFSCTRKHLEEVLGLKRKSIYNALRWLEREQLVLETKVNGNTEFMVNPHYITVGAKKKKRLAEWYRRLYEHLEELGANNNCVGHG